MIPYGRQDITQSDIDSVIEVLQSDFLTQGPKVPEFEKLIRRHVGCDFALALNSATSALHVACLALDLGPGDWLWTTPITFVASANCGLYCGSNVDFVDIDPRTYNLCPDALGEKLELAEKQDRLPKVLVAVHLSGQSCDMSKIWALAKKYGFKVIEDASHAIGGKYKDKYIGNCEFSDITVFSFHPVKIITTAEGGIAVTNDSALYEKMQLFRSHGITRSAELMCHEPDGPWYYQQLELGYNYRMTELQAALGISQLHRLDQYVKQRHELANRYNELLANLPLTLPWQHDDSYSGRHLYIVRLHLNQIEQTHRQVFESLRERGVGVNLHYIPVHTQPYFQKMGFKVGDFPVAESYYRDAISIPLYPALSHTEQLEVVAALESAIQE